MAEKTHTHRITVCTLCRHAGTQRQPGAGLIEKLNTAITVAWLADGRKFSIEGTACMAGCSWPCTVAFSVRCSTTYLFGYTDDNHDNSALIEFARLDAERSDGLSNSLERPAQLSGKTLARIPASIIQTEESDGVLQ